MKRSSLLKIGDAIAPVKQDQQTKLFYVDLDGQATSGITVDELIEKLRKKYGQVTYNQSLD